MKRGDVVIARIFVGRVRVAEETLAPGESYARLIGPTSVLVGGVKMRAFGVRSAPKAVLS